MPKGSTLTDFARELASQVDKAPACAGGREHGRHGGAGLAALTGPERTAIISSWKGPHEMPPPIKLLRGTHPERLLTRQFIQASLPFMRWQMGVEGQGGGEALRRTVGGAHGGTAAGADRCRAALGRPGQNP